jgi:hypothetical protein
MKLSMPVVVGDKVLLDSGAQIETDKILDTVRANGVLKLDVHKSHIPELAEKYPEFYGKHGEEIAKAKQSGRLGRVKSADEWSKARKLRPKAPVLSLIARPQDLPDLKKLLMPYFPIEMEGSRYREMSGRFSRSKMLVVWVDGFTKDELQFMAQDSKKENPDMKFLAITSSFYQGPWDVVRWMDHGLHVFRAVFSGFYPEQHNEFETKLIGSSLQKVGLPSVHVISDDESMKSVDQWLENWEGLGARVTHVNESQPLSNMTLVMAYFSNGDQKLPEKLKTLFSKGFSSQKTLVVVDKIDKSEVEPLKAFGRLMLQMGGLENDKLSGLLKKVLLKT